MPSTSGGRRRLRLRRPPGERGYVVVVLCHDAVGSSSRGPPSRPEEEACIRGVGLGAFCSRAAASMYMESDGDGAASDVLSWRWRLKLSGRMRQGNKVWHGPKHKHHRRCRCQKKHGGDGYALAANTVLLARPRAVGGRVYVVTIAAGASPCQGCQDREPAAAKLRQTSTPPAGTFASIRRPPDQPPLPLLLSTQVVSYRALDARPAA